MNTVFRFNDDDADLVYENVDNDTPLYHPRKDETVIFEGKEYYIRDIVWDLKEDPELVVICALRNGERW